MSEPLHVIVTLSPETIAAIAEALRPKPSVKRRAVFIGSTAAEPSDVVTTVAMWAEALRNNAAFQALSEVTVDAALEALGVPVERRDHPAECRVGKAFARLGYRVTRRDGGGGRARYYSRTP